MLARIAYVFRHSRRALAQAWEDKQSPDDFLYGANRIQEAGYQVDEITRQYRFSLFRVLWAGGERLIAWRVGIGFSLPDALAARSVLQRADAIICTVDAMGLPIALLKKMHLLSTPLLTISQGLSDRVEDRPLFRLLYRKILGSADCIVVLGEGAADHLQHVFGFPRGKVAVIPFGVDGTFWHPGVPTENPAGPIVSVGKDISRDYDTLLAAVGTQPLQIITSLRLSKRVQRPNVYVRFGLSDLELRALYQQARFVVTPLKDVTQPSGQSATLQAMACGKAVILTRTRGLWEPRVMRHMENCYLIPPSGVAALRSAIQFLENHPEEAARIGANARRTALQHYPSKKFAGRLLQQLSKTML